MGFFWCEVHRYETLDLLEDELCGKDIGGLQHYRNIRDWFKMMGTDPGQSKIPENLENQNIFPGNRYPGFSVASNKQVPENQIRQMVKASVIKSLKKEG